MKRYEQARMLIGLAIPGSGPVAVPTVAPPAAVAPPAVVANARRRWFDGRGTLTSVQSWSRRHGMEGYQVAYFFALLGCGILFGLFVGGYVGFIQAATPAADLPDSYARLATSDPQWAAMARQDWLASHHVAASAVEAGQQPFWRRLAQGAVASGSAGDSNRVLWPVAQERTSSQRGLGPQVAGSGP